MTSIDTKPLGKAAQVAAPGGSRSLQRPGLTPDRSTIPGHHMLAAPQASELRRPLSEYRTAAQIMSVYTPNADGSWDQDCFEQAPVSAEEARKAHPANLTPSRPVPGFALGTSLIMDAAAALDAGKAGE